MLLENRLHFDLPIINHYRELRINLYDQPRIQNQTNVHQYEYQIKLFRSKTKIFPRSSSAFKVSAKPAILYFFYCGMFIMLYQSNVEPKFASIIWFYMFYKSLKFRIILKQNFSVIYSVIIESMWQQVRKHCGSSVINIIFQL